MNNGFIKLTIFLMFMIILSSTSCSKQVKLNQEQNNLLSTIMVSPDNNVSITFTLHDGQPTYKLNYIKKNIFSESKLGLSLSDKSFGKQFSLINVSKKTIDNTWEPILGKVNKVRNHYNQYTLSLKEKGAKNRKMNIIFRLYDDGIAFRYHIPQQDQLGKFTIIGDNTSFAPAGDITWWAANDEHENLGPLSLNAIPDTTKLPFLAKYDDHLWFSILEAAIYDYSNFMLSKTDDNKSIRTIMLPSEGHIDKPTSWRVVMLGKTPGAFIESNLLTNLNPPNKIKNSSWIIPGKSMWDWRVWGYKAADGFEYGLNTDSHIRMVDFAAENKIKYLLIDADWYGPEFEQDSDPTKARARVDIHRLLKYAKDKDVKVILYLNDVAALKYGLETILAKFHTWGAAGIKYGFMEGRGQEKVLHTRQVVELCAKYELLVNFHDLPIPPSGDTRTWPNLIAREYCHAQADAKRSYWPETAVSAAFVNMTTGPLDMTNGWYDLNNAQSRPRVFQEIPGTIAAETAKLLIYSSGLMVLPDAPESYSKAPDLFEFIKHLPDEYDEVKVLGGTPDSYISMARRKGVNWYLASLTNREKRTINIELDFLKDHQKYTATIYEDGEDTHYTNNKLSYSIREIEVDRNTILKLNLAAGGGCSVRIFEL